MGYDLRSSSGCVRVWSSAREYSGSPIIEGVTCRPLVRLADGSLALPDHWADQWAADQKEGR